MMSSPFVRWNVVKECLHQSRFARSGSAADDAVLLIADQFNHGVPNVLRHTSQVDQLIGRIPAVEFADGQGRPVDRRWRSDNGDARAIRQTGIEDWILGGKVLAQDARNALDRCL